MAWPLCLWHGHSAYGMVVMASAWSLCCRHCLYAVGMVSNRAALLVCYCLRVWCFTHFMRFLAILTWEFHNGQTGDPRTPQMVLKDLYMCGVFPLLISKATLFPLMEINPRMKNGNANFSKISKNGKAFSVTTLVGRECPHPNRQAV